MWNDEVRERYWWAEIQNQIQNLVWELSKAEDEEEVDLYWLRLHFDNEVDLRFFTQIERDEIKRQLSILIADTEKHLRLLNGMNEELKTLGENHVGEAL